jgi:hypothetical protein
MESAIRLVSDYPAAVWVFKADHLAEIANFCMDLGAPYDRVAYLCSKEFHERREGQRTPKRHLATIFRPTDPAESLCSSTPSSESAASTGRDPDPVAPRHLSGLRTAQGPRGTGNSKGVENAN